MTMNRPKKTSAILLLSFLLLSCGSYNAYQKAKVAEQAKDWGVAVQEYERALQIDPDNRQYMMALERARREASRVHFEKGKTLFAAAQSAQGNDQLRLAQLAVTELQLTVQLDSTNQFAAVEMVKAVEMINQIKRAASEQVSIEEIKRRAHSSI